MRNLAIVLALLSLFGTGAVAADSYPPVVTAKKLYAANDLRGKEAPALVVEEWLTGAAPDTNNKVVLIDFWATWCPPCRELIPELNGYKKKFGDDLVVIGISDEEPNKLKEFMKTHQMDYNVAVDQKKTMKSKIGVSGIPHVIVMSPDHIVRWQGYPPAGEDPLTEDKIAQIITASKH